MTKLRVTNVIELIKDFFIFFSRAYFAREIRRASAVPQTRRYSPMCYAHTARLFTGYQRASRH